MTLAIGLALTGAVATLANGAVRRDDARRFGEVAQAARTAVERRVDRYSETLHGLRALAMNDGALTLTSFRRYLEVTDVLRRNPGSQAFSFNRAVPARRVRAYERRVRSAAPRLPPFRMHPRSGPDPHYVIEFIEPLEGNETAIGFDIGSRPDRRTAVELARDLGTAVATPPLALVQDGGGQTGFLLFLPVYDTPSVPVTAPSRRRHFVGVVTAVFRVRDMLAGVLGSDPAVNLEIYDVGPTIDEPLGRSTEENLLFDQDGTLTAAAASDTPGPWTLLDINVADRRWRMFAQPVDRAAASSAGRVTTGLILAGTALTFLVAGLIHSMTRSRALAESMAIEMTASLREREEELRGINVQLEASNLAIEEANRDLRAINEAMTDFVSIASHELRSPIATIMGYASVAAERWDALPPGQREQTFAVIHRQAETLSRLVDDLLTVSRIQAGEVDAHPRSFELADLLGEIAQDLDVTFGTAEANGAVFADRDHTRRILTNYIDNAGKYGALPISVSAERSNGWVELTVSDRGDGVPPEFVPRLFDRFARAPARAARNVQGTGLGLSIVRGLAEANGGTAWYEANEPNGSRFCLRLPAAPPGDAYPERVEGST